MSLSCFVVSPSCQKTPINDRNFENKCKFLKNITTLVLPSLFFPVGLRRRCVLRRDHVGVGGACRVCLFQLFPQLAHRRLPNTWRSRLQVSVATFISFQGCWKAQKCLSRHLLLCVCVSIYNSKILTLQELPVSDEKAAGERLSHKNGDARHSTEKLPNGPDAAPSKSTNSHLLYTLYMKTISNLTTCPGLLCRYLYVKMHLLLSQMLFPSAGPCSPPSSCGVWLQWGCPSWGSSSSWGRWTRCWSFWSPTAKSIVSVEPSTTFPGNNYFVCCCVVPIPVSKGYWRSVHVSISASEQLVIEAEEKG